MIYVENDFYSNFNSAVKSDDDNSVRAIMLDQISSLIATRRDEYIKMLKKVGIKVGTNPTNEDLAKLTSSNISKSKSLQAGIGYLIAQYNDILDVSEKTNRTKKSEGENDSDTKKESLASTVSQLASALTILTENYSKDDRISFKNDLISKTNSKAPNYSGKAYNNEEKSKTSTQTKKSKKWLWIAGIGLVIAVGYYGHKQGWFNKINNN